MGPGPRDQPSTPATAGVFCCQPPGAVAMVPLDALAPMAEPLPLPARPVAPVRQPMSPVEAGARAVRFFALSQIPAIRRLS